MHFYKGKIIVFEIPSKKTHLAALCNSIDYEFNACFISPSFDPLIDYKVSRKGSQWVLRLSWWWSQEFSFRNYAEVYLQLALKVHQDSRSHLLFSVLHSWRFIRSVTLPLNWSCIYRCFVDRDWHDIIHWCNCSYLNKTGFREILQAYNRHWRSKTRLYVQRSQKSIIFSRRRIVTNH